MEVQDDAHQHAGVEPDENTPLRAAETAGSVAADIEANAGCPHRRPTVLAHAAVPANLLRVVVVLMLGVFVSNADGSLMLATHPIISSEFGDLARSSWLFAGFILASAATQTLYGQLSDIYGRKNLVLASYVLFTGGCAMVGAGKTMLQVIIGRAISGAGSAGMTVLVSILISDLLPIRDVAAWRSYVSIAAAAGRSLGGPVGGWLADMVGWRWSFIGQVPVMLLATLLCLVYLPPGIPPRRKRRSTGIPADTESTGEEYLLSAWQRIQRVDFLGSALLALMLLAFLLPLELGSGGAIEAGIESTSGAAIFTQTPSPSSDHHVSVVPILLLAAGAGLLVLFIRAERYATEPVLPLDMFRIRDADLSVAIQMCQVAAQMGLMFSVPLYFKATADASSTVAGAHLFPSVAGHAVGGIFAGRFIKKTGHYRSLVRLAAASSSLAYVLLLLRWKGGTNWLESMYTVLGGFGGGIIQSAIFVSVQVVVLPEHLTAAISVLYLTNTCAAILGLACVSRAMQTSLRWNLPKKLLGLGLDAVERDEIFRNAVSNMDYLATLKGPIKAAVVEAYVDSLW